MAHDQKLLSPLLNLAFFRSNALDSNRKQRRRVELGRQAHEEQGERRGEANLDSSPISPRLDSAICSVTIHRETCFCCSEFSDEVHDINACALCQRHAWLRTCTMGTTPQRRRRSAWRTACGTSATRATSLPGAGPRRRLSVAPLGGPSPRNAPVGSRLPRSLSSPPAVCISCDANNVQFHFFLLLPLIMWTVGFGP